jgi:hypothetical protein
MQTGRTEHRGAMNVAATLRTATTPPIVEKVWIQNISSRGARIRCRRTWQAKDHLVLIAMFDDLRADAEVVYCERLSADECAVGLKFAHPLLAEPLASGNTV